MAMQTLDTVNPLVLVASGETLLVTSFAIIILKTKARATILRTLGIVALGFLTYFLEQHISQLCLRSGRPHWAVTAGSLLWVQLLSASELSIVSRVDVSQLPGRSTRGDILSAVGLLWNMRRIGTRWQVKNVPLATGYQSRTAFLFRRIAVTLGTYLFVDALVSMPPPDPALVEASKTTFLLHTLSLEDAIFRVVMTISYWISTAILNLFMTNVGAIVSVLLHLSRPEDCPPLYGSFSEAYNVRRFWGISWHQMFRSFLTGHADLIVNALPVSRQSLVSRYTRLAIAFFISGVIHYRADQLMGVPNAENGAILFFLLHALVIMLEDIITPITSKVLPARLNYFLGWVWVTFFFIWSSPIWIYSSTRVGVDSAALLPVRLVGPWVGQFLSADQTN